MKRSTHPLLISAPTIAIAAILLTGCSDPQLEYRNAQISNGLIYENKANSPFTGTINNLPLPPVQPGGSLFVMLGAYEANIANSYGKSPGITHPQSLNIRASKCTADVKEGYLNGKITCFTPSTTAMRYEANYTSGTLNGTVKLYATDGKTVLAEWKLDKDIIDGSFNIYSPTNSEIIAKYNYKNGTPDGNQLSYDNNTRAIILDQLFEAGKIKHHQSFTPKGTPLSENIYEDDGVTAKYKEWDPETGVLIEESMRKNGYPNGPSKRWDNTGMLISNGINSPRGYESLMSEPATPKVDAEKCLDIWIDAYHKEVGEEAMISADQTGEWEGLCNEGKLPK